MQISFCVRSRILSPADAVFPYHVQVTVDASSILRRVSAIFCQLLIQSLKIICFTDISRFQFYLFVTGGQGCAAGYFGNPTSAAASADPPSASYDFEWRYNQIAHASATVRPTLEEKTKPCTRTAERLYFSMRLGR